MNRSKSFPCLRCEMMPGNGRTATQFRARTRPQLERHIRKAHLEPRASGYHRRMLGAGNAVRAVTSARRSAPGRMICTVENVKPAFFRAHHRKAMALREQMIEKAREAGELIEAARQEHESEAA